MLSFPNHVRIKCDHCESWALKVSTESQHHSLKNKDSQHLSVWGVPSDQLTSSRLRHALPLRIRSLCMHTPPARAFAPTPWGHAAVKFRSRAASCHVFKHDPNSADRWSGNALADLWRWSKPTLRSSVGPRSRILLHGGCETLWCNGPLCLFRFDFARRPGADN